MNVLEGFSDLQARKIIDGEILVQTKDGLAKMNLFVTPTGHVIARPEAPPPIDQIGEKEIRQRHQGVDQA